ncbi:MAG: hypothetical protein R2764_03720 [Bacteroidales bacterium]
MSKISNQTDQHRKFRILRNGKSDFYYHIDVQLKKFIEQKLALQKESFEEGVEWYINKLEEDILRFPQHLAMIYDKSDFKILKGDSAKVRAAKLKKLLLNPFAKKYINGSIRFRELGSYYLKDNRFQFLISLLGKFEQDVFGILSNIRPLITSMDDLIVKTERQLQNKSFQAEAFEVSKKEILEKAQFISRDFDSLQGLFEKRLFVEYRKNLNIMAVELEKVNVNSLIKRKRRSRKYYKSIKLKCNGFAEEFYNHMVYALNKIYMDVLLQSHMHRIEDKFEAFSKNILMKQESGLIKKLELIKSDILLIAKNPEKTSRLKIDMNSVEDGINLLDEFETLSQDIAKLNDTLPETLVIATSSNSTEMSGKRMTDDFVAVPLRKIAVHFIETKLLNSAFDYLENSTATIRKTVFVIKDQLSLARFNVENITNANRENKAFVDEVIQRTIGKISKEEEKIIEIRKELNKKLHTYLVEAFEPLYSYKIEESVEEFSSFVREYQSRKVRNKFEAKSLQLRNYLQKKSARLMYSKSEGILLAKQLMKNESLQSTNESVLDFIEKVSPKQKVLDNLPHYYNNLFSGRSSISEDFWVSRTYEESMLSKALRRYREGHYGGILIVGDRNCGKTAFCRYYTKNHFSKEKVYHLFPLLRGSTAVTDFKAEIQKITNLSGEVDEILEALPHESVIVIHDLEMWWERSPKGYAVIKEIIRLITEYCSKCLFIVNLNPYAYEIINDTLKIEDVFISMINSMPFDSQELKEMIIRRHHSSGMKFKLKNRDEDSLSEFKLAGLFSRFFDNTEGNPGVSLNLWLSSIEKISGETIYINSPHQPEVSILETLDPEWQIILIQFILHKRLTREKLENLLLLESGVVEDMVESMRRNGLLTERANDLYMINVFAEPFLIKYFKQKGLL